MRRLMRPVTAQRAQHFAAFVAFVLCVPSSDVAQQRGSIATLRVTNFTEKVNGT